MQIRTIFTPRKVLLEPGNDLVYEWEDIFAEKLGVPFSYDVLLRNNRWTKHLPVSLGFLTTDEPALAIEMVTYRHNGLNKRNIIPWIVDFYLRTPAQLKKFYKTFSRNPLVLISSREAYEFLKEQGCPLDIRHLPLSLPDKYRITPDTEWEKKYDVVLFGRQNAVMKEYWNKYRDSHPGMRYIEGRPVDGGWAYFDEEGRCYGKMESWEDYFAALRASRVAFYSTQGIDGGEARSNGFNQVTPKFLEMISAGCNVIARFPDNPDTRFYRLSEMCRTAYSYEEFEREMESALAEPADMEKYSAYLEGRYTSDAVGQFKTMAETI